MQINKGEAMNLHIGTKLVQSKPMSRADYNTYRGWTLPLDENGNDDGYLVEYLDGGASNHPDHRGYISWSPKDVFDGAYQDITKGISFGAAVEMAKLGHSISRLGWNGAGMYAYIVPERLEKTCRQHCPEVPYVKHCAHWALKTASGDIATWTPSCSDSLAEDWCVVSQRADKQ